MKKISLLFLLLVFPVCVFAKDTCDPSNIKIESITLEDTKGNIEEVKEASSDSQKINLGLRMNVVGDTASYKIVLKNNSNEDYYFDEKSLNLDTDYIDYEVNYEDGNNLMKGGEEKVLFLKVVYKEKMDSSTLENGLYQDTQVVKLNLTNNNIVDEILENPLTGRKLGLLIFIFLIVGCILFYKEKKKSAYMFFLVGLILPFGVQALCRHSLEIKNYLVIDAREAVFLTGKEVNVKMKQLAGDDTSTVTNAYSFKDQMITSIQYSEAEPDSMNKEEKNVVSTPESEYPIYMWYDNGTIYWWSEDKTPTLNEDASYMFYYFYQLNNLDGISDFDLSHTIFLDNLVGVTNVSNLNAFVKWNVSNVREMKSTFSSNRELSDITGVKKWDTSNVENMYGTFMSNRSLLTLSGIENWDTSKVTDLSFFVFSSRTLNDVSAMENWDVSHVKNMKYTFSTCFGIEEINMSKWKTNSLTNMNNMFAMLFLSDGTSPSSLKRIYMSEDFDTSKVTDMAYTFYNLKEIEDYSFLQYFDTSNVTDLTHIFFNNLSFDDIKYVKDWDVSNVTNMNGTFIGTESLTSLEGLENWDVSNVEDMSFMFRDCISLKSLNEIKDWNVSKVLNYKYMFYGCRILQDVSSINDWNISKNADFTRMFAGVPVLPEFSKVNGTWSNGTFTPSS